MQLRGVDVVLVAQRNVRVNAFASTPIELTLVYCMLCSYPPPISFENYDSLSQAVLIGNLPVRTILSELTILCCLLAYIIMILLTSIQSILF